MQNKLHNISFRQTYITGKSSTNSRRKNSGFTLIEILITMAIMTILFVATGAAFDAAFKNYDTNTNINTINTLHRNFSHQFSSIIRSAYNDPDIALITVSTDGNSLSLTDADARDIVYQYNANEQKLTIQIDSGTPAILLENVIPIDPAIDIFSLSYPPLADGFPSGTVTKVSLNFAVSQSGITKNMSIAAVPRNIVFSK